VGYDDHRPLGEKETGANTALPIWLNFMNGAGQGNSAEEFPVPEGINWLEVNLSERYPLPLFERSPLAKIPYTPGARITPSQPARTLPEKRREAEPEARPADLTDRGGEAQTLRAAW